MAVHVQDERMVLVIFGEQVEALARQECILVQKVFVNRLELFTVRYGQQHARFPVRGKLGTVHVFANVRIVIEKPLHALDEAGHASQVFRLECLDGEKWNQTDHGPNFHGNHGALAKMQHVVIETIFVVPQADAVTAHIVHGLGDVNEVLEKFAGDVFVRRIFAGQFHGHGQHIEAEHSHPTGSVRLFDIISRTQRSGAVEDADIVETEKAAFKYVLAFGIFAIHPPGKIQQKLKEHAFQKIAIFFSLYASGNFIDPPDGPGL